MKELPIVRRVVGPSARMMLRVAGITDVAFLVLMLGAGITALVVGDEDVLRVTMWVLLGGFVAVASVWGWFAVVVRGEGARGYTTLDRRLRHLPQLDPRTGRLVRRAGDPFPDNDGDNA